MIRNIKYQISKLKIFYPALAGYLIFNITLADVYLLKFSGPIGPVSVRYISQGLKKAENGTCLILLLDTPGGLDDAMREITKNFLASPIPIITFIYPSGARAASAGVFIAFASHIVAMAEGTNIGAAHPVALGGKEMDEELKAKVTNDAAAYLKSIAEKRGRNVTWAEDVVRKSVSVTEKEALKLGIIDIIANSVEELIAQLDGMKVKEVGGEREKILRTRGERVIKVPMTVIERFLLLLTNPNIAYILLLLGIYGLIFELQNPGSILPGVVGAISLILAFYSLQLLPVNYAGLALILLAIIMFILEVKITSYGLLTIGGITSLIFGSLLLFQSPLPFFRISLGVILLAGLITALFFILVVGLSVKAHLRKPTTGKEGLIGAIGVARTVLNPRGTVFVYGELWSGESINGIIQPEEKVQVIEIHGMVLKVKRY